MMVEITCPYCGRKFQVDIDQLVDKNTINNKVPGGVNIKITSISPMPKYYVRRKDGKKLPYLPYPLSQDDIDEELDKYKELAEKSIVEIAKVTGEINENKFNVVIWYMKDAYYHIAYVINGKLDGGPMRVKDVKYLGSREYPLKIPPFGYSSIKKKRHKLNDPEEIDDVMRYIGDFVELSKDGYFIFKEKPQSIKNKDFLRKLILIWYAFYARFDIL